MYMLFFFNWDIFFFFEFGNLNSIGEADEFRPLRTQKKIPVCRVFVLKFDYEAEHYELAFEMS